MAVDKIFNLEEQVWFSNTKAEPQYEQSKEAHLEEREGTLQRDGKELEVDWTTE